MNFSSFFHLFDDETAALTSAAHAICHSPFDRIRHEDFAVPVEFDNLADLYQYPFDQSPADDTGRSKILAKLRQFRGNIKEGQAIQLFDSIHIFSLKKRQVDREYPFDHRIVGKKQSDRPKYLPANLYLSHLLISKFWRSFMVNHWIIPTVIDGWNSPTKHFGFNCSTLAF